MAFFFIYLTLMVFYSFATSKIKIKMCEPENKSIEKSIDFIKYCENANSAFISKFYRLFWITLNLIINFYHYCWATGSFKHCIVHGCKNEIIFRACWDINTKVVFDNQGNALYLSWANSYQNGEPTLLVHCSY